MSAAANIRETLAGYVAGLAGRDVWAEQVTGRRQYADAFLRGYTQGCAHRIAGTARDPISASALICAYRRAGR